MPAYKESDKQACSPGSPACRQARCIMAHVISGLSTSTARSSACPSSSSLSVESSSSGGGYALAAVPRLVPLPLAAPLAFVGAAAQGRGFAGSLGSWGTLGCWYARSMARPIWTFDRCIPGQDTGCILGHSEGYAFCDTVQGAFWDTM